MLVHPYPDRDFSIDFSDAAHIRHRPRRLGCQRQFEPAPLSDLKQLGHGSLPPPRRPEPRRHAPRLPPIGLSLPELCSRLLHRLGVTLGQSDNGGLWLENENGVIMQLKAQREGIALSLGGDAIYIRMND